MTVWAMALSSSSGFSSRTNTLVRPMLPTRSRKRRSSGWNRMMSAKIPHSSA